MHDRYTNPLCTRYAGRTMQHIYSDDNKFSTWRRLWVALAESEQELGLPITDAQLEQLRAQGVRFYLTEHIGEVNDQLRHFEAGELIETGAVRRTIRGALRDAGVTLDPGSSYQRIPGNMDDIRQLQELEWLYGADAEVQIERNVQLMLARMRTTDDVSAVSYTHLTLPTILRV